MPTIAMNHPDENLEPLEPMQLTTVLNHVRPTVVVRRRVYEVARVKAEASPLATHVAGFVDEDDDDSGPPSSVNVARALASLRADELHRLEQILTRDEEEERAAEAANAAATAEPAPPVPTLHVGPTIALPELARAMSVPVQELVTALVTRGFFSVTVKTVVSRETARAAAWMFGWTVEDNDEIVEASTGSPGSPASAPAGEANDAKRRPATSGATSAASTAASTAAAPAGPAKKASKSAKAPVKPKAAAAKKKSSR